MIRASLIALALTGITAPLAGCATRAVPDRQEVLLPTRPVPRPVRVVPCDKDQICDKGQAVTMSRRDFENLQKNVQDVNAYILQLERLLKELVK